MEDQQVDSTPLVILIHQFLILQRLYLFINKKNSPHNTVFIMHDGRPAQARISNDFQNLNTQDEILKIRRSRRHV